MVGRWRELLAAAAIAAIALFALLATSAGCSPSAPPASRGDNLLVVTICGLRGDVLARALASGAAPELAVLHAKANFATELTTASTGCLEAHVALFSGDDGSTPAERAGAAALPARLTAAGCDTAAFVSRSELFVRAEPPPSTTRFGFSKFDLPPIERLSGESFGEKAAAVRLRRSAEETARAAVDWLAHARSPFLLWVELDALAIEAAAAPDSLEATATQRLAAIDTAIGALQRELARAGRDRRTLFLLTADHGEAFGEEGWYGHRRALPAVARVPLWIVDPDERGDASGSLKTSRDVAPWLARRMGLTTDALATRGDPAAGTPAVREPELDAAATRTPTPFLVERGELPLTDGDARALLPALRPLVEKGPPEGVDAAELYLAALFALTRTPAEEQELIVARRRWFDALLARPPRAPLLSALFARSAAEPEVGAERRLEVARAAVERAPWYFPAVRALASTQQMRMDAAGSIATLEQFGRDAPLAPDARAEFEKNLEVTRRGAMPSRGPSRGSPPPK